MGRQDRLDNVLPRIQSYAIEFSYSQLIPDAHVFILATLAPRKVGKKQSHLRRALLWLTIFVEPRDRGTILTTLTVAMIHVSCRFDVMRFHPPFLRRNSPSFDSRHVQPLTLNITWSIDLHFQHSLAPHIHASWWRTLMESNTRCFRSYLHSGLIP